MKKIKCKCGHRFFIPKRFIVCKSNHIICPVCMRIIDIRKVIK